MSESNVVAVLGAGSAGQGMAGYLARSGYRVHLWNRPHEQETHDWLDPIREAKSLELIGWGSGHVAVDMVTTDLDEALEGARWAAVTVSSEAQREVGRLAAHALRPGQMIMLLPGRTGGALDFRAGLLEGGAPDPGAILVAESITTVVNARALGQARVRISGAKERLPAAALPATDTLNALQIAADMPFVPAPDVLSTSLENFGVTNHAVPMVVNASRIEADNRGYLWYMEGVTRSVARVIAAADTERMALATGLGARTHSLQQYLIESLDAVEGDLFTSLQGNTIYKLTPAPPKLDHRFLWEEVLTGIVPMVSLAEAIGQPVPLLTATLTFAEALLGRELRSMGRTVERLGLGGMDAAAIQHAVRG